MTVLEEFLGALAFAGDLTMGQPPEHSPVTACLAAKIAQLDQAPPAVTARAAQLAMIRWGGCTANAVGFADLLGDDVRGRREILAGRDPFVAKAPPRPSLVDRIAPYLPFFPSPMPGAGFYKKVTPLVFSHCEVVGEIAKRAGFSSGLIEAIDSLFEYFDGSGWPRGKTGGEFDRCVQYVWLASDIEAYCRFHGQKDACGMILERGGKVYDKDLAEAAIGNLEQWLTEIQSGNPLAFALQYCALGPGTDAFAYSDAAELLSDFSDLKRPEFTGLSRAASNLAGSVARELGLTASEIAHLRQGVLLCTLGYVSVNSAALTPGTLSSAEAIRLVPYWTERILSRAPGFGQAIAIASQVFERLDGSGWHKGLGMEETILSSRIAQVAVAIAERELQAVPGDIGEVLNDEVAGGRMDPVVVAAAAQVLGLRNRPLQGDWGEEYKITQREREVLAYLIHGKSNKEIARLLTISPKTVGRHLENSFRKLGVTTRAAAAIKALKSGLVPPLE